MPHGIGGGPQETTVVPQPPMEELIGRLSETADYGERSYEEVVEGIRSGAIRAYHNPSLTGRTQPLLTDVATGKRIKGTGVAFAGVRGDPNNVRGAMRKVQENHEWFLERSMGDREAIYKALVLACVGDPDRGIRSDPRAMKIYFDYFIGAPERYIGGASTDAIQVLLAAVQNQRREVVIDESGRRIE